MVTKNVRHVSERKSVRVSEAAMRTVSGLWKIMVEDII